MPGSLVLPPSASRTATSLSSPSGRLLTHIAPGALSTRCPARLISTSSTKLGKESDDSSNDAKLTHVCESGSAQMVSISDKLPTRRVAKAVCAVKFTSNVPLRLIKENQMKKGDVLGVARVAGIMASKRTPDLIPLCHPIAISHVSVELVPAADGNRIDISATVTCDGKTGVEMEALTAASTAALTVYDMCKAVDKGMIIEGLRVVRKEGGKSGLWIDGDRVES